MAGMGSGLLDEQGLTLDDFGVPPEPSLTNLTASRTAMSSQQPSNQPQLGSQLGSQVSLPLPTQPIQWQSQPVTDMAMVPATQHLPSSFPSSALAAHEPIMASQGQQAAPATSGQLWGQQLQQSAQRSAPAISFQDFLQIVEVRFLDDVRRRTSFIPPMDLQTEPLPKTFAESLEVVHVAGARLQLYQQTIQELADKLEGMQSRMNESEVAIAKANPRIFKDVQVVMDKLCNTELQHFCIFIALGCSCSAETGNQLLPITMSK